MQSLHMICPSGQLSLQLSVLCTLLFDQRSLHFFHYLQIIEIQKEDIARDREIEEIAIVRKIITERTDIMIETEIVIGIITEKKKVEEVKIPCQLKKLIKCEPL